MDNIIIRLIDGLPCSVRAFTVVDENGDYNVYLNSKLSHEQLRQSVNKSDNNIIHQQAL